MTPKVNWPLSCLNDREAARPSGRPASSRSDDESILSAFFFFFFLSPSSQFLSPPPSLSLQSQYSLVPSRHCKPNGRTDGRTDHRRTDGGRPMHFYRRRAAASPKRY